MKNIYHLSLIHWLNSSSLEGRMGCIAKQPKSKVRARINTARRMYVRVDAVRNEMHHFIVGKQHTISFSFWI